MLDHVAYEVWEDSIPSGRLNRLMWALGLTPIPVDEEVPDRWNVEWYTDGKSILHFVEVPPAERASPNETPYLGAGHFAVVVDRRLYDKLKKQHHLIERNSGSGRLWLSAIGLRVEVRCEGVDVEATREGFRNTPEEVSETLDRVGEEVRGTAPMAPGCFEQSDPCSYFAGHKGRHSWEVDAIDEETEPSPGPQPFERMPVWPQHWEFSKVLEEAFEVYKERYQVYQGDSNWQREGMKGALFNLRRKVERAWDNLWNRSAESLSDEGGEGDAEESLDDLIDVINYAAFAILSARQGREGNWFE